MADKSCQGAWQGDYEDGGTDALEQGAWQASSEPAAGGNAPTGALQGPLVGPLGGPI